MSHISPQAPEDNHTASQFFCLPSELRNRIYCNVFANNHGSKDLNFLLSCRQTYHEAGGLAFHQAIFQLDIRNITKGHNRSWLHSIDRTLSTQRKETIQNIHLLYHDENSSRASRASTFEEKYQAVQCINHVTKALAAASIKPTHISLNPDADTNRLIHILTLILNNLPSVETVAINSIRLPWCSQFWSKGGVSHACLNFHNDLGSLARNLARSFEHDTVAKRGGALLVDDIEELRASTKFRIQTAAQYEDGKPRHTLTVEINEVPEPEVLEAVKEPETPLTNLTTEEMCMHMSCF